MKPKPAMLRSGIVIVLIALVKSGICSDGISASTVSRTTVDVCFGEMVERVSATTASNYSLDDTNLVITSIDFGKDQSSAVLTLSARLKREFFVLGITNVLDSKGNRISSNGIIGRAQSDDSVDVGTPGVNPLIPGTAFSCRLGAFRVVAGGTGLIGNADAVHFAYQIIDKPFFQAVVNVDALETVSRFSQAGLMIRENLTPGSRFFALVVTPPALPAKDGSGLGFQQYQALYRETPNGPVAEWRIDAKTVEAQYPGALLSLAREFGTFRSFAFDTNGAIKFAEHTPPNPFPQRVYVGIRQEQ